ncbi:transmembrane protein, putative (macronuclear) [Tetrahymena thermophila SB210]|uniref:Transmembrane protein, putative n=1 Tax=Tetrahymena thermophila (strain SB210) TaxID=312017 RepID=Q23AN0_TETTS|nr:transmembrane protein, putative [Tetrahymena thermophila SB210]EAR93462.2 transmembrane protein, putative [Tetrahymena thermophila SB210]|eukprot:XP_001013707.2 transmembrane protein, putative [Tetrahymena thermophila SB210]
MRIQETYFKENSSLLQFSYGTLLQIDGLQFTGNQIENSQLYSLIDLRMIEIIQINNSVIQSNSQNLRQNQNSYFISIAACEQINLLNITISQNLNSLVIYVPNVAQVYSDKQLSRIQFINSTLVMKEIIYRQNIFDLNSTQPVFLIENLNQIYMQDCQFNINIAMNSYLISLQNIIQTNIVNATFYKNKLFSCFQSNGISSLQIDSSIFTENETNDSGSCLLLSNFTESNGTNSYINNSQFNYNIAKSSGGAIYLENTDIQIENSLFSNNKATIGGAIRYLGIIPKFAQKIFQQKNKRNLQQQLNITFKNNQALIYGQNIGSIPSHLMFKRDGIFKPIDYFLFENIRSGEVLQDNLFYLLDEEFNTVNVTAQQLTNLSPNIQQEIKTYQLLVQSNNIQQLEVKDTITFNYVNTENNNVFNLNGMKLQGIPIQQSSIKIIAPFIIKYLSNNSYVQGNSYDIQVNFRECQIGEIYSKISEQIYECSPCANNSYSIVIPLKDSNQLCQSCPFDLADSCYLNQINVKDGYWRKNENSDQIIYCNNKPENCKCQQNSFGLQIASINCCIQGFIGPLCEVCDNYGKTWGQRYGNSKKYTCTPCNQYEEILLQLILQMLILTLYFLYSVKKAVDKASRLIICQTLRRLNFLLIGKAAEQNQVSFYIKLIINFIQHDSNPLEFIKQFD